MAMETTSPSIQGMSKAMNEPGRHCGSEAHAEPFSLNRHITILALSHHIPSV